MRRQAARVASAALAAGLLAAVAAGASAATGKVIAHGSRLKATRIFFAQGTAVSPSLVSVRLSAKPVQPVKVQWALVCQKPNKADPAIQIAATSTQGETTVTGPATVKLKLPFKHPPTCVASVYGTLTKNGSLVLQVLQA
jgi:hypothetical protein